jgi:gamma-glutamyl:cysteine ligase YbdK (ATP-grasp superfamily)
MGRTIDDRQYCAQDYERFNKRIHDQVDILKEVISRPEFGADEQTKIGAELELYLVNDKSSVSPVNLQLLEMLNDPQFVAEINQYNIELNLNPYPAKGKPFTDLTNEMLTKFNTLWETAQQIGTRPLATGILPTLEQQHLTGNYMTNESRYHILGRELRKLRGEPFHIHIDGEEQIDFKTSEICVEGANTSFQVHLMVEKEKFAQTFNAAQLTLPIALSVAANSSVLFGNTLWDESRVSLFKQSMDVRVCDTRPWRAPARVNFGQGWCREGAWELFAEAVNIYEPLFPQIFEVDENENLPELAELNLHMGTIWPWNRPVYSNNGNGHLRIEFRALPSGPTAIDMAANSAFMIGMAVGLQDKIDEYMPRIPFRFAEYNFYSAARNGLDATILWPQNYQHKPVEVPIRNIVDQMLQVSYDGLTKLGVDSSERDKHIQIIQRRLNQDINPAKWQKLTYRHLQRSMNKKNACEEMLNMYFRNQMEGHPVTEWERIWK